MSRKPALTKRFSALLIDYGVILCWMAVIALVSVVLSVTVFNGFPDTLGAFGPYGSQIVFFFVLTGPVGLYLFMTEAGKRHATLGKRKAHLEVQRIDGGEPTAGQIAVRTIVKLLPWELAHFFVWQMQYVFYVHGYEADIPVWIFVGLNAATVLATVYVLMVLFRKDGRSLHDLVARTVVASKVTSS